MFFLKIFHLSRPFPHCSLYQLLLPLHSAHLVSKYQIAVGCGGCSKTRNITNHHSFDYLSFFGFYHGHHSFDFTSLACGHCGHQDHHSHQSHQGHQNHQVIRVIMVIMAIRVIRVNMVTGGYRNIFKFRV